MIALIAAFVTQNPVGFWIVSEEVGKPFPTAPGRYLSTCEARVIGRKAVVLLDTVRRGLPMKIENLESPKTILEVAVKDLGEGGTRAVSEPETGYFAWVTIKSIRRLDP